MPEGPEIRRAADRIGKALIGQRIEQASLPYSTFIGREHLIEGQTVVDVTSVAKAMLIRFQNGWTMYSHNQLYTIDCGCTSSNRFGIESTWLWPHWSHQQRSGPR